MVRKARSKAGTPITGSGCTCGPVVAPGGHLCDWDDDGAQIFCDKSAAVSLGVALRTVLCERHFKEHAATCGAKGKAAPAPPAPPPVDSHHELAGFLQEGGSEAYENFERALREMMGCRECGGKPTNPETGLCLVHDYIAARGKQ
jgi:hypothetical protein